MITFTFEHTCACLQTALTELGSQLTDAKTRLVDQEAEIKNADSKLQLSLSEAEKLKTSSDAEKKSWVDEKTLLTQRAETVEAALKEVTTELTGLKTVCLRWSPQSLVSYLPLILTLYFCQKYTPPS